MVEVVLLRSSADGGVCPQGLKSPPFLAVLDGAASRAAASAEEKGLYSLLKKSAFGWRSAFSAALKSLLSAGALAPEVLEFRFSANCWSNRRFAIRAEPATKLHPDRIRKALHLPNGGLRGRDHQIFSSRLQEPAGQVTFVIR